MNHRHYFLIGRKATGKCVGNAVAEYAISGGVLVLVVLAALTALNFPERIGQFLANTLDGEYGGSSVRISTLGDF